MTRRCPKCDSAMTLGVIIDKDQSVRHASTWVEGAAVKGWFGLKLRGKKPVDIEPGAATAVAFWKAIAGFRHRVSGDENELGLTDQADHRHAGASCFALAWIVIT